MEGIIGRRVLSDVFILFEGFIILREFLYPFHVHVSKVRLVHYDIVPIDTEETHYIDENTR